MSSGWHPLLLASPEATLKSGLDLISVTFNNGHEDVKNLRNLSNECINSQSQPTWDFMVSNPQPPGGQVRTNAALLRSCILQPKEHRSPRSWCNVSNKQALWEILYPYYNMLLCLSLRLFWRIFQILFFIFLDWSDNQLPLVSIHTNIHTCAN